MSISPDAHRALVAFASRTHLEGLLRELWANEPTLLPEGVALAPYPLPERLWALYGALRFGCTLPPASAESPERDADGGPHALVEPGALGWTAREEDMLACYSLIAIARGAPASAQAGTGGGSGRDPAAGGEGSGIAGWPDDLHAAADALHASAGRQLVLPLLARQDLAKAAMLLALLFGPRAVESELVSLPPQQDGTQPGGQHPGSQGVTQPERHHPGGQGASPSQTPSPSQPAHADSQHTDAKTVVVCEQVDSSCFPLSIGPRRRT